jgi:hypothetical protein
MFNTKFDLFTTTCLLMDKPNKEWTIVPPTINAAFVVYIAT